MKYFATLIGILTLIGCSHGTEAWRKPAAAAPFTDDDFQTDKDDEKFAEMMAGFNLEETNKYIMTLKTSSTSVGMKIAVEEIEDDGSKGTDKLGTWLPENAAAQPEPQVVSYHLGQFLHMGDYVVESAYYPLGPKATAYFKSILNCSAKKGKLWQENCNNIKTKLAKDSTKIDGILRNHVSDEVAIDSMIDTSVANGTLNSKHKMAQFLKATGTMPSAETKMDLGVKFETKDENGKDIKVLGTETELNLARQFSQIMVLDILTGQFDRFSGSNIEAIYKKKKGVVQFIANDNGGASMNGAGYSQYYKFLSRFDLAQIQRVERLYALLQSNPDEVKAALHMRSKIDSLKNRCKKLLDHVKALETQHGKDKVYFPVG